MRPVILALLRFGRQNGLQYNGTLQAFFLQFAAVFIRNGNIAVNKVGIGMAAAAAKEPCPALAAGRFRHYVGMAEFLHQIWFHNAGIKRAEFILLTPYKLVAGVNIAFRSNGKIFMPGTAASQPFGNAGPVIKCNIKMEKVKRIAFMAFLQVSTRQFIVFFVQYRQIFFGKYIRFISADNRFYGNFLADCNGYKFRADNSFCRDGFR